MKSFTWANVKSVALHALIAFGSVFGATMAATGYSVSKAAIVAACSAGITSALHYLAGFLPNPAPAANRANPPA